MALMKWYDEEDEKDESGITQVASVQSGWQPAPSGANSAVATDDITTPVSQPRESYLLSEEKAQADQQKRQRDAQVAEARRVAAAQAAYVAAQQQEQQVDNTTPAVDPSIAQQKRIKELQSQKAQEDEGLGRFFNGFKDRFFDANSTQDRLNRVSDGAPEMYQEQQKLTARDNVQSVATNPFKRIYEEFTEAPRRVGYAIHQATGQADQTREAMVNLEKIQNEGIAKAQAKIQDPNVSDEERLRWYNFLVKSAPEIAQSQYDNKIQMAKDAKDGDGVAVAAALAEMGVDIATLGLGGKIATQTAKLGLKGVKGAKLLEPVLSGAVGGGLGAVTSQGRDVTPEQAALGMLAGAGLGGILPIAGAGTGRILRPFKPGSLNAEKAVGGSLIPTADVPGLPEFTPVVGDTAEAAAGTVSIPEVGDVPRINTTDLAIPENPTPLRPGQPEALEFEFARESPVSEVNRDLIEEGDLPSDRMPEYLPSEPSKPLTDGSSISKIDAPKMLREAGLNEAQIQAAMSKLYRNNLNASYKNLRNAADEVASPAATVPASVVPATEGAARVPVLPTEQVKALQDSKVGKSQGDEALINEELQRINPDSPAIKTKKIHPDDQDVMASFIDHIRGIKKLDEKSAYQLELDAARIAEYYGLGTPNTPTKLANLFDQRLMQDGFGKPPRELSGAALQARMAREAASNPETRLPEVDAENTRLFGENANDVRYNDGITTETGNKAVGVTQDGRGESSIMIDRNTSNPEAVFHHEAVHKTLNDFTAPEQRAAVVESYRNQYKIDKNLTDDQVEELVSDDFAKFVANKRSKDSARAEMNLPQQVKDYFEQVWQQIQDTYVSLVRNGQLTPEFKKLYDDLNNGKYVDASVINKAVDPRVKNRYMVAGKNAANFDPEDKAGRNFIGIEGKDRFEIDDSAARITDNFIETVKSSQKSGRGGQTTKLGDVIQHDKLFEAYPELKNIDVSLFYNAPSGGTIKYGGYSPLSDSLRLNAHPRTASELRATILHEVQHAIQKKEGFARGLTPAQSKQLGRAQPAGEGYFRSAEEIESRLVETRSNMSQSERDATSFYDSVPADKPLGRTLVGMKDYSTLPQVNTNTRISKEMAAAGTKPTPNKNPVREPFQDNLPSSMTPVTATGKPVRAVRTPQPVKPKKVITPEQQSINEFSNRVFSNTDLHKDFKKRLARALGLDKDSESSVSELLSNTNSKVSAKDKAKIESRFAELEAVANEYNALMKSQRKNYQKGKASALDEATSKRANQLIDRYGFIERDLNSYVRKIQGRKSIGNRLANAAENIVGARNASILTSVGGVSRNVTQELGANILDTFLHPIKMAKGTVKMPAEIIRSYKKAAREYTIKPKTVSEFFPWAIGNTYRTIMSPVTGIANVRKIVARESIAEALLRAQGETPTRAEIKKFAGAMGADSEVVANNMMGILNGMTSHGKGLEVMRAYEDFIKTGSAAAKETFLNNTERSSNLAAKLTQVAANSDNPSQRLGIALLNTVFPFVNTATNLAKTAVTYTANPFSRSINDEILKNVRSNPENVLAILKNKAVTYGVLGGVYALHQQGVIGYNDGEDPAKPKGIYIHKGGDEYFPVRATPIELPIAAVVTAAELAKDVAEGNPRPLNYYLGILGNSLPYVDSATNIVAATGSAVNGYLGGDGTNGTDDNGYAAKAYAVNTAKSFVPWSNNGITPAINNMQGKSTNAKSVYDKDMGTWLKQSILSSYPTGYRDQLKDSRDAAGRVRTVDQQGLFTINKTINDANTAEFNEPINELVTYARDNGLGKGTQDMFNTYDTGKNNNFKSIQDTITFLDATEIDGKTTPDNTKKLEKNPKLADLSRQIRDAFYGGDGAALLTLDGEELYSDVSVPNKNGTKNSTLPISMQSITNAIAATDLPEEQRDRMFEISQANTALYDQFQAKAMTYDQYSAQKAQNEEEYISILSNSESFKTLSSFMDELDSSGFFEADGMGSTRSGQTYLWNILNTMLGSKGKTPAANYPEEDKGWGSGGGGNGLSNAKSGGRGAEGVKWTPVQARQMAKVKKGTYTPFKATVRLGNEVKKDKTQNYVSRSF